MQSESLKLCKRAWNNAWALPESLNPWQWAEKNLELSARATAYPGRYSTRLTPYVRQILEDFQDPEVRKITLCFSAQSSKTMTLLVMLAYCIDQDPGPALLVQSSLDAARSFSKNRLQPLIEDCKSLNRHKTSNRFDFTSTEMILDRMSIFLQGAGSPSQLASRPIKYLFADEVDKWPDQSEREADALNLALERVKSYRNHKIVMCSTPTIDTAPIWQGYKAGSQCKFQLPCPDCGAFFVPVWNDVKWDKLDDGTIENVFLRCPNCEFKINEKSKSKMLAEGIWQAENSAEKHHRSYHLSEICSPWSRWQELAKKFVQAKHEIVSGSYGALHNFINSSLAEIWEESRFIPSRSASKLELLKDERKPGEIPNHAQVLTAGIDTQDDGFWYVIRAWGEHLESWLVEYGFIPKLTDIYNLVYNSRYQDSAGTQYQILSALIDSQGHRTTEIYELCRSAPIFTPIKGEQRLTGRTWTLSRLDTIKGRDGKKYPVPGGLNLTRIDTTYYKDILAGKLNLAQGAPGFFHVHSYTDKQYFKQMVAENKNVRGVWECPKHRENHLWDCEVYALAAADISGARFQQQQPAARPKKPARPKQSNPYTNGRQLFGR